MYEIKSVKTLNNYQLYLKYGDGTEGTVDLSYLVGKGEFALWDDYQAFRNVRLGASGELVWSERVDLCPDSLYLKIAKKTPEDAFPNLKGAVQYGGDL